MNSYHFSLGNSSEGAVGFCARVLAPTPERAVEILRGYLLESVEQETYRSDGLADGEELEYLSVYFNRDAVTAADIDEAEPADTI